jgi:hypothetical protein
MVYSLRWILGTLASLVDLIRLASSEAFYAFVYLSMDAMCAEYPIYDH